MENFFIEYAVINFVEKKNLNHTAQIICEDINLHIIYLFNMIMVFLSMVIVKH